MKKDKYNVAVVGATGAVGNEMVSILEEREFPVDQLKLLASKRSADTRILYGRGIGRKLFLRDRYRPLLCRRFGE
jgi:aspartate-semialdehyde dehydrogenase